MNPYKYNKNNSNICLKLRCNPHPDIVPHPRTSVVVVGWVLASPRLPPVVLGVALAYIRWPVHMARAPLGPKP